MKLRLTRRALGDLDRISDYLHDRSPSGALRVRAAIQSGFQLIVAHPQAGRRLRYGVRRLTLPRFPYLIFYKIDWATRRSSS